MKKMMNFVILSEAKNLKLRSFATLRMTGLVVVLAGLAWNIPLASAEPGKLMIATNVQGEASVVRGGQKVAIKTNDQLQEGDQIITESGGTIDLAINNLVGCRILPESESTLSSGNPGQMQVSLTKGKLIFNLDTLPSQSTFKVETPTAIASVRGTQGLCDINAVAIRDGSVDVTNRQTGQTFTVGEGFALDCGSRANLRQASNFELTTLEQSSSIRTCG